MNRVEYHAYVRMYLYVYMCVCSPTYQETPCVVDVCGAQDRARSHLLLSTDRTVHVRALLVYGFVAAPGVARVSSIMQRPDQQAGLARPGAARTDAVQLETQFLFDP